MLTGVLAGLTFVLLALAGVLLGVTLILLRLTLLRGGRARDARRRATRGTARPLSLILLCGLGALLHRALGGTNRDRFLAYARAAAASPRSPLIPASTRGSSCATSATTSVQPSSATTAERTCAGIDSAPPPWDVHRPVAEPEGW